MKKLAIGIMGSRGIPNRYGGFEQFAGWLSEGLSQKGHHVFVYNSSQHPYKEKSWQGVNLIHCADKEHRIGTAGQFIYDLNCINDARKRNFDVLLHLGYTSDAIWHKRWPKKTVNIVNMDGMEWKRSKYNRMTRGFLRWSESMAVKTATLLVADSMGIQQHLLARYERHASYIPYGAKLFEKPDPTVLKEYQIEPGNYFLLIARMEPENNIEMIIRGHLLSGQHFPLLIIGNMQNSWGKYLLKKYGHTQIKFAGAIFDETIINNLRYHAARYFHGHSVGGTNPSLLEAMACGSPVAAHDNIFNRAILENEAAYFSNENEIASIISTPINSITESHRKQVNLEKIKTIYNPQRIIDAYESLMLSAC